MNSLEYIIEDIYNEEQKKGFFSSFNPKNWSFFSGILSSFSALNQYKEQFKNVLQNKSVEYKKLVDLFSTMKDQPNKLAKVISELIENEAKNNNLKISDIYPKLKEALSSNNPIGNILSLFNVVFQAGKKVKKSKELEGKFEEINFNDLEIRYFSEYMFEEIIKIKNLELINEVKTFKKKNVSSQRIYTKKEAARAGELLTTVTTSLSERYSGISKFFAFFFIITVALVKIFSFGGGLGAEEVKDAKDKITSDVKDFTFKITAGEDLEKIKSLSDEITTSETQLKNINDLKDKAAELEKNIAEKEGSLKAKFGFGGDEIKKMKADLETLKKAAASFGDSEKIKSEVEQKKLELQKANKSIESKQNIFNFLTGEDFGKQISDQQIKDGITSQLNNQSIKFLEEANENIKLAETAKTGLFDSTLSDLESRDSSILQNASAETKVDVVNKYLEDVKNGKIIDAKAKEGLDSIKKLENKAEVLKKAGFAIAEKKITTKDLDIFAKKNLAEQVAKTLNPDNPAEYDIEYTYDAKTGEIKIDTTTQDYKTLEKDIKMLQNDPDFKNFNKNFKETISKIGGDINKLTKSVIKLQDLKNEKADLQEKLDKASMKDKTSIQDKIDKIDAEFEKVSGNQDQYSVTIGLEALEELADSKQISIEDTVKMYKAFQLNDQIESKILAANNATEMKSLGFTDANEFRDYKSLNADKSGTWSVDDNKEFVNSMKYSGLKFSDIKKVIKDSDVKNMMNGKLWDIKDSSGKWKISVNSANDFKKLVEQKIAQKSVGETKKAVGETKKAEVKETKVEPKKSSSATESEIDKAAELKNSVKDSYKNLNTSEKNLLKERISDLKNSENELKQYKEDRSKISPTDASEINKIDLKIKAVEKSIDNYTNSIIKTFQGTGLNSQNFSTVINDANYVFTESHNDIRNLFTILEQNYFKR